MVVKENPEGKKKQTKKQKQKRVFTVYDGGTWSVQLKSRIRNDCIEILKTVAMVIN